MIPCIMIGDSIAYGVGQARPECETIAKVGIASGRYVTSMLPPGRTRVGTAVISLGVNDGSTADTLDNLRTVRGRIQADSVVWLLPGLKEPVREMIRTVAAENGDRTLDTRPEVGRDHLHPTGAGYERIAAATISPGPDTAEVPDSSVEVAFAPDEPHMARHRTRAAGRASRHAHAHALSGHGKAVQHAARAAGPRASGAHAARSAVRPVAAKAACTLQRCRGRILRG